MNYFLMSLYDAKADLFSPVQAVPNVNAFIRMLGDLINSPHTPTSDVWVLHPEDFQLAQLGFQDDATGLCTSEFREICQLSTLVRS